MAFFMGLIPQSIQYLGVDLHAFKEAFFMERTQSTSTRMLVEGAMMIAIATVLSFVKFQSPFWANGGSITAASMVPLLVFAYRWGGVRGIFVSAVYGIIQFIMGPYAAHPMSIILDYPLAFGAIGAMGFFATRYKTPDDIQIFTGITIALGLRMLAHFLSGVIFFASYAQELNMNPFVYSIVYNATYMVPEIIISCVVFKLMKKAIDGIK